MFYVYILENQKDKSWYIGYSSDLKRRIQQHNSGNTVTTKRKSGGWRLIYYESYLNKMDAIGREKFFKGGAGRQFLYKQLKNYLLKQAGVAQR